ncbi:anti-sigma factor [Lichenicoccus sp.]|uniref:anti-sigma factor n=1 Tax=Lichenicoccus sp. TaxID=2781899 RepID=UPI003D12FBD2
MSGAVSDPAEDANLLAAEYVLGTLCGAERATVEREALQDPGLRAAIAWWEARLAPLAALVAAVPAPAALWPRIQASAWGTAAPPVTLFTSAADAPPQVLSFWRATTAVGFALAAAIAGIAVFRPEPPVPVPPQVTALVPLNQQAPVFLASVAADGSLSVRPLTTVSVAPDRDLELWLLKDGEKAPTPLGLLPASGAHLAVGTLSGHGPGKILVSLEPRGGSKTGLPTGPVLYGGGI